MPIWGCQEPRVGVLSWWDIGSKDGDVRHCACAWSGGHVWRWVRPLLRSAGHEVFMPALTGLGERSHLASAQVDLETHVRDVIAVLEYEDLARWSWWP